MVSVLCSRWGNKYPVDYVNKLYSMVKRHLPMEFKFYCQTDDTNGLSTEIEQLPFLTDLPESTPEDMLNSNDYLNDLPRLWDRPKLNYAKPNAWGMKGMKIALDLDILIHSDMIPLIELYDKPLIGRSWWHDMEKEKLPGWRRNYGAKCNGSFYLWCDDDLKPMWDDLQKNWKKIYFVFHGGSDNFITSRHSDLFNYVPEKYYYSYNHCGNKINWDKIICTFNTNKNEPSRFELHEWARIKKEVHELWQ